MAGDRVVLILIRSRGHCYYCAQGESHLCKGVFMLSSESRLHTREGAPVVQGHGTEAFAEHAMVDQSQLEYGQILRNIIPFDI